MTSHGYEVLLTEGAEQDLESIHAYIAESDGKASADAFLDRVLGVVETLTATPERGACPRELLALGIRDFRQLTFRSYRVIYRVTGRKVYVHVIADGRRDMQSLLARRLLRV